MDAILRLLEQYAISDIQISGYLDEEESGQFSFHWLREDVYIVCGEYWLRCQEGESDLHLELSIGEKPILDSPVYEDADAKPCTASLMGCAFYDRINMYVTGIEAVTEGSDNLAHGIIQALGLEIENNTYIFVHPMSFDGLTLGREAERNEWLDEFLSRYPDYQLHRWKRVKDQFQLIDH